MATVSNIEALVRHLEKAEAGVVGGTRAGVTAAALAYTTAIRAEIAGAATGSRLRGVGTRGAKVGVGFDAVGGITRPTALISARGPLHLLERDVRKHLVAPRRRQAMRISGAAAGEGFVGGVIEAGGSQGKRPFEKGIVAGTPLAREAMRRAIVEVVSGPFE